VLAIRQDGLQPQATSRLMVAQRQESRFLQVIEQWASLAVLQSSLIVTNRELGCFCQTKLGTVMVKRQNKRSVSSCLSHLHGK